MYRIILCNDYREGRAYALSQKFPATKYRVASRAGSIRGLKVAEVHQLVSFDKRRDKHSILAALRYARVPAWYVIDDGWVWPPRPPEPEQPELPFDDSAPTRTLTSGDGAPASTAPDPETVPLAEGGEVVTKAKRKRARKSAAPKQPSALLHYLGETGALHAVHNVSDFPSTPQWSKVTCEVCLQHKPGPIEEPILPDVDYSGPVTIAGNENV